MIHVFDIECFRYDWITIFKNISTSEYTVIHNDNAAVKQFMTTDDKLLCGFNNKHYDNHILKAILCGADNALIKEINDYIMRGEQGFNHWFIKQNTSWFNSFDIRDDMQQGLSLKAIEGHLGMPIKETLIPFDIDRPLTTTELAEVVDYCKYDVGTTERLINLRKTYLEGKLLVGRMKGIPDTKALYATNAKITALFLEATFVERDDDRDYIYPQTLNKKMLPMELIAFFDQTYDLSIPTEEWFKKKIDIEIAPGTTVTYGFGGVHQGLKNYVEVSEE